MHNEIINYMQDLLILMYRHTVELKMFASEKKTPQHARRLKKHALQVKKAV